VRPPKVLVSFWTVRRAMTLFAYRSFVHIVLNDDSLWETEA
jgi:hypothetical protein